MDVAFLMKDSRKALKLTAVYAAVVVTGCGVSIVYAESYR